jgi:tetratricopeptide (TPR) repeat protein
VRKFLIGIAGLFMVVSLDAAVTNPPTAAATTNLTSVASRDPVEDVYEKLLEMDDDAQAEADRWIKENEEFAAKGAGAPRSELNRRIRGRFEPVRKAYEGFIKAHPDHAKARIAYGSFLNDLGDEGAAIEQYEKAATLDPKNPAVYNNLANIYTHIGPIEKAFGYYGKAIELNPLEPVYHHNLGTTVYLFRKDAMTVYKIDEQQVYAKAFGLYSNAMRLDPGNFPLASDVAQTYYGIRPLRTEEALQAWTNALKIAHDPIEREGVYLHFARIKLMAGRFKEAREHVNSVTNAMYNDLKQRIQKNLEEAERKAAETNAPAPAAGTGR